MPTKTPQIDLPEELFLSLTHGYAKLRKRAEQLIEPYGITVAEYHFMRIVQNEKRTTASVIRKRLSASAPTVAQLVASLEQKKFITRAAHKEDKRMQPITLTAKGRGVLMKVRLNIQRAVATLPISRSVLRSAVKDIDTITSALISTSPYGI